MKTGQTLNVIGYENSDFGELAPDTTRFPVLDSVGDMVKIAYVTDARIKKKRIDNHKDEEMHEKIIQPGDFSKFCADGWVSKKDRNGVNQLKPYCLIRRTHFDMLIGLLARTKHASVIDSGNIEDMVKGACEQSTGDPILEGETISEYIQRIFYIPFRELSISLQYLPWQLQEKLSDPAFRDKFNKDIGYKYELLNLVRQEKTGKLKYDNKLNLWKPYDIKPKQWFFLTADGMRFCWLPFEYLP
ncbi:MAG: hypothetical protein GY749_30895 [Desulfobacteraceae bacterium]|nr:hypothetical protein [Desulfobacteraceae bacterium]